MTKWGIKKKSFVGLIFLFPDVITSFCVTPNISYDFLKHGTLLRAKPYLADGKKHQSKRQTLLWSYISSDASADKKNVDIEEQNFVEDKIRETIEDVNETTIRKNDPLRRVPSKDEYERGLKTIAFITLLFSSNSPVLHAAFSSVQDAPPVLLLNAAVSTIALSGLFLSGPLLDSSIPLPCTLEEDPAASCLYTPDEVCLRAGMELGLVKMLGTTANLYGLSLTTAGHGAFLIQLTTLIVPVFQFVTGIPIPKRIWAAIAMALTGVFLFTSDPAGASSIDGGANTLLGDSLCVVAAIFYATYDLRLFEWGKKVPPLKLIVNKVSTQAALSVLLLLACGFNETKDYITRVLASGWNDDILFVGSAAIWSGLAINAVAPFLQVGAQQAVGATRAQVVYASQPLWAGIMSYFLLNELVGPEGLSGGMLFLAAMFLAATAEAPNPNCENDICEV